MTWLEDPRLPARAEAARLRFYGKFPSPPWRSPVVAERVIPAAPQRAEVKLRVQTNRTRTRWWFVATWGPEHDMMAGIVSTTSKRKAEGWIAALTEGK